MKFVLPLILGTAVGLAEPTPQGPTVDLSRDRSEIVLNGMWRFQPAESSKQSQPVGTHWGEMPVPGTWIGHWRIRLPNKTFIPGKGDVWKDFGKPTVAGWYERSFTIPATWGKRKTVIQFGRLSTDALVSINRKPAGTLGHLGGELDITQLVEPGKLVVMRVFVAASQKEIKEFSFEKMTLPDTPGDLTSKGITGDVVLLNLPTGARVDHVSAFPSVRKKQLTVEVDLADAAALADKQLTITGEISEVSTGKVVKRFKNVETVDSRSTLKTTIPWTDPRLWDTHDPFLHRISLTVTGEGIDDQYVLPHFGFREIWVEGKSIYLNGSLFRFRPAESNGSSHIATIRADLSRRLEEGHNILEIWPNDSRERGYSEFWSLNCIEASKMGMLMMIPPVRLNEFFRGKDNTYSQYMDLVRKNWRKYVNEPSVVVMVPTGNLQGLGSDMNPRWLGRKDAPPMNENQMKDWIELDRANAQLSAMDPTRLILHHQGGPRGDIYATNMYLNWVPLQEREEWLSEWANPKTKNTQPYCAIEFGTPLDCSFFRNRDGFGNAYSSESNMTEYSAIYLGPAAYEMETEKYREEMYTKDYKGTDPATGAARWPLRQNPESLVTAPAFQEIQKLFQRNTGRSWRTWGLSGGMVPWNEGFTHRTQAYGLVDGEIHLGDRGGYYTKVEVSQLATSFHDPAFKELPASKVMRSVHKPTLAWIAGEPANWPEKGHNFKSGEKIKKSVSLINDSRQKQGYHALWELRQAGAVIKSEHLKGTLKIGEIKLLPIIATLPEVTEKSDFTLHLTATIGEEEHTDKFALRAWPQAAEEQIAATLYDPVGETAKMLARDADPLETKPASLTIIGRSALSSGKMPVTQMKELEKHVSAGNTLLIMAQDPEWMKTWWGFRICRQITRQAWPVNETHPMWQGIDAEDLCDWRGAGSLIDPKPTYNPKIPVRFMYRWGAQGSISSAAVEKPHLSGWTPLLQCEFDLQYSPLMELRRGKGRVILCLLDLEDQAPVDPAAEAVLSRLMKLASEPPAPRKESDGIAANDFPPRIGTEKNLAPILEALHAPRLIANKRSLKDMIQPLQVIHKEADAKPWLRFSRWRLTRVEHQIQANAGKAFPIDGRIFHPRCDQMDLSAIWRFRAISRIWDQPGQTHKDPGISPDTRSLCQVEYNDEFFEENWVPDLLMDHFDGDAVIRRDIEIPSHWQGKPLNLDLGVMKTTAIVFFNGQAISGDAPVEIGKPLKYRLTPEMVKPGKNVLAVRIWNVSGSGGWGNPAATKLTIGLTDAVVLPEFYHADYRNDFKDGDDPYRYFRW